VTKNGLYKNDLMILDLIQNNNWNRPIYFNDSSMHTLSFDIKNHLVQEGIVYRLLPVENPDSASVFVNVDLMYHNIMEKYIFREMNNPEIYYDSEYFRFASIHRSAFNSLAEAYVADGNFEKASEVINRSLEVIPDSTIPYDMTTPDTLALLFEIGEGNKAIEIARVLGNRASEMVIYLAKENKNMGFEFQKSMSLLYQLSRILGTNGYEREGRLYYNVFVDHFKENS
jgi:tetratricopeptide (TPR) repeat protein